MLRIECFHRVLPENLRDEQWPYFTRGTAMTVDAFTHYIDALSREYEFVDEQEAHSLLTSAGSSRRACWVTFDDGYLDNLRFAAPVLERFGVRPTLFMTTRAMGGGWWPPVDCWYAWLRATESEAIEVTHGGLTERWDLSTDTGRQRAVVGDLKARYIESSDSNRASFLSALARAISHEEHASPPRFLGEDELVELSSRGWFVGPHGHEHRLLTRATPTALRTELLTSHQALDALPLKHRSRWFAYPDGRFDEASMSLVSSTFAPLGYVGALTIDGRDASLGDHVWALPRHIAGVHM